MKNVLDASSGETEGERPRPLLETPPIHEEAPIRRIYRSRRDRVVAGVAGGLAHYFDIDPVIVRLAFVLLALVNGVGVLAYVICAIVIPSLPADREEPEIEASIDGNRGRELAGYILLAVGSFLLIANLGLLSFLDWGRFWPVLLILVGALLLFSRWRDDPSHQR